MTNQSIKWPMFNERNTEGFSTAELAEMNAAAMRIVDLRGPTADIDLAAQRWKSIADAINNAAASGPICRADLIANARASLGF